MIIDWQINHAAPSFCRLIQTAADAALAAEGIFKRCAVTVRLTDDETIRHINAAYRGVDKATDVLSFPQIAYRRGHRLKDCAERLKTVYDDTLDAAMLGDIVISVPRVLAQAKEYGHPPAREAAYMMVHAVAHLMGYDHLNETDKKEMRGMEEKALAAMGLSDEGQTDESLLRLAVMAMEQSYSPYSRFRVGAALRCADGRVYQGCNIENASFGMTICAERTAVVKAVSEGAREFSAIAIASDRAAPWPCGACRQVLNEFAPGIRVLVTWNQGETAQAPLSALLPHGFGPADIEK